MSPAVKDVIFKVRRVVLIFRKSPLKNSTLAKYSLEDLGKELTVIKDCKTRWNSTVDSLERFLELKNQIRKALIDHGDQFEFSEAELALLKSIVDALCPIKVSVLALCQRDQNLLKADVTLSFMLEKLEEQDTLIARDLKLALRERISQRRNAVLVSLLKLLNNPDGLEDEDEDALFAMSTDNSMMKIAKETITRLFPATAAEDDNHQAQLSMDKEEQGEDLSQDLQKRLAQATTKTKGANYRLTGFAQEFRALKRGGGDMTEKMSKLKTALLSIPPTSVESERAFSAAGLFMTKLRCRMLPQTLNMFCFLRSYFLRMKK